MTPPQRMSAYERTEHIWKIVNSGFGLTQKAYGEILHQIIEAGRDARADERVTAWNEALMAAKANVTKRMNELEQIGKFAQRTGAGHRATQCLEIDARLNGLMLSAAEPIEPSEGEGT